jgi:hypothetical protein
VVCGTSPATNAAIGVPLSVAPSQRRARTLSSISTIVGVLSIVIFMRSGHRSIANLGVAIADIVSRS